MSTTATEKRNAKVLYNDPVCLECCDRYGVSVFKTAGSEVCVLCSHAGTLCHFADRNQELDRTIYTIDGVDGVEFTRASADAVCRHCRKDYQDHPMDRRPEAANWQGDPFLHVLCNGNVVKL
jgi:hypothetical protein